MSKKIELAIEHAFEWATFVFASIQNTKRDSRHAIVIPPTSPGSAGDQAMVCAITAFYAEKNFDKIEVIRFTENENWGLCERYITGEHAWPSRNPLDWLRLASPLSNASHLTVIGADIVDGKYGDVKPRRMLALMKIASRLGVNTRICGFSMNEAPTKKMKSIFRSLSTNIKCFPRDPVSCKRFMSLTSRHYEHAADLAFLLKPSSNHEIKPVLEWITESRKNNEAVVLGLNLNYLPFTFKENTGLGNILSDVSANIASLLKQQENLFIVFVPHDNRGNVSDEWFAESVFEKLPKAQKAKTYLIRKVPKEASCIKALAAEFDCAITGRMHFLIALMGQKVPGIGVTYQGKFDGLYKLFDLEGLVISPEDFLDETKFIEIAQSMISARKAIQKKLNKKLPHILELSEGQLK